MKLTANKNNKNLNLNHISILKELNTDYDFTVYAIRRGFDEVGYAVSTKPNTSIRSGSYTFESVVIDSVKYFNVNRFKELTAKEGEKEFMNRMIEDMIK